MLVAPPGAGKSTVAPLALKDRPWAAGKRILMLAPRRLAARAAAMRMAANLNEKLGETVGLRVRMESRVSGRTRVEVVTEGVFVRRILAEPDLPDVAAVLFDEFHERSLDADLGLALALDVQSALRPDLRLLPMSATLDDARLAALLGDAPVVRSEGRMHPVETRYLGREAERRVEDRMAAAVRKALAEEAGGVLAFLPGRGEIERTMERLADVGPDVEVLPLHGGLDPRAQDRAVAETQGRRKVVLATAIAETSLTIPDIRIVIDAGLARAPRFDAGVGLTRLVTERATLSAVEQRRGRAGRVGPGVCYRLWDEAETRALPPYPRPEILEADLSPLLLATADWGVADAASLPWLDLPPAGPLAAAADDLAKLEALRDGAITAHGKRLLAIPAPPRLAHMISLAAKEDQAGHAALLALLVTERGLGGGGSDLCGRLARLWRAKNRRADAAKRLAARMAAEAGGARQAGLEVERSGAILARAWPERIAKTTGTPGRFQMANGRQAYLDETDPLAREDWIVVADATGRAAEARILSAAPITPDDATSAASALVQNRRRASYDAESDSVRVREERRLGRIRLSARPVAAEPDEILEGLKAAVQANGLRLLDLGAPAQAWLARIRFVAEQSASWPDLSEAGLIQAIDVWAPTAFAGARGLADVGDGAFRRGIEEMLDWSQRRAIEVDAPENLDLENGRTLRIAYDQTNGPTADAIIQDLFGVRTHPTAAGRPVLLRLLSPARRPAQTTRDLPGFWNGSYVDVRSELRGRYPKHAWPDDPGRAAPPDRRRRR